MNTMPSPNVLRKSRRAKWVEGERPAVAARQLFERIHALWTTVQREGDRMKLALADGILSVPDLLIRHPVISQRISLAFDASGPEFSFSAGTEKVDEAPGGQRTGAGVFVLEVVPDPYQ